MCVLCGLEKMSLKGQGKRREVKLRWRLKRVGKYEEAESVSGFISDVTIKCSVLLQSQLWEQVLLPVWALRTEKIRESQR